MRFFLSLILLCSLSLRAQWSTLNDFPGNQRDDAIVFNFDSVAIVGTGVNQVYSCTNDFYKYSKTSNSWTQVASFPGLPRQYASNVVDGNRGFLFGGQLCGSSGSDFWMYNPITDKWIQLNSLPDSGRYRSLALVKDSKVWVFGGRSGNIAIDEVWTNDLRTDEWKEESPLPFGERYDMVGFEQGGVFYMGLGTDSAYQTLHDWYSFNPDTRVWNRLADHPGFSSIYNVFAGSGSRNLIYGGSNTKNKFKHESFEYLPEFDRWQSHLVPEGLPFRGSVGWIWEDVFYTSCGLDSSLTRLKSTRMYSMPGKEKVTDLKVWPNPVKDNFRIEWPDGLAGKVVELFNEHGEKLSEQTSNQQYADIDLSGLAPGFYVVRIGSYHSKILKL